MKTEEFIFNYCLIALSIKNKNSTHVLPNNIEPFNLRYIPHQNWDHQGERYISWKQEAANVIFFCLWS